MASKLLIVRNIIIALSMLMVACKPLRTGKATPQELAKNTSDTLKNTISNEVPDRTINVHYENGLVSFNSIIDMQDDFYIELKGSFKSQNINSGQAEQEAATKQEDMQSNSANCAIKNYISAKKKAESGQYLEAMVLINNSIECLNTGEALALKGSIYFLMKDTNTAESYWGQATLIDPTISVPKIRK
jgi:hypothetical protein